MADDNAVEQFVEDRSRRISLGSRRARAEHFGIYAKWIAVLLVTAGVAVLLILWGLRIYNLPREPKIITTEKIVIQREPITVVVRPDHSGNRTTGSGNLANPDNQSFGTTENRLGQAGRTMGVLNVSLKWNTYDDLDLEVWEPGGNIINYRKKTSSSGGKLDIDRNAGQRHTMTPIENIKWEGSSTPKPGKYQVWVVHYQKRSNLDPVPFEVEVIKSGQRDFVQKKTILWKDSSAKNRLKIYEFSVEN